MVFCFAARRNEEAIGSMPPHPTRRHILRSLAGGSLLMPGILSRLLAEEARRAAPADSLAPKPPHFPGKAKRVILLYMSGGVSHLDTFDPKPRLFADGGKRINNRTYLRPKWEFQRHGQCGMEVSDLFPHLAGCVDDICLIRSMRGDHSDHFQATLGIHTGSVTVARPSLGAWVSYGLGTENQNLPSFVVLAPLLPYAGSQVWGADFLPGCHQGTRVLAGPEPIPDLTRRSPSARVQELELGLLDRINRLHGQTHPADPALAARVKSFETAFGMQQAMPEVLDFSKESDETHELYGLERGSTKGFGWQCLVARRMVEHGVRFVELIDTGASNNWDSHADMAAHGPLAKNVDKPIAGLLTDLKRRGLLSDTLVVWTSEFGRAPTTDGPKGRSHQATAYSSWLAGAGVKAGYVHGQTDDYGAKVAADEVHVHDFHATILHLLGFDHERLTYRHAGRDFRLTDVSGRVVREILT
jgi:hypothetical protein